MGSSETLKIKLYNSISFKQHIKEMVKSGSSPICAKALQKSSRNTLKTCQQDLFWVKKHISGKKLR